MSKQVLKQLRVILDVKVYVIPYGINDVKSLVNTFNEVNEDGAKMEIIESEEI